MNFENEYLGRFIPDSKSYNIWIYYYYLTEEFDRNCLYTTPSRYDEDCVIPYGSSRSYSDKYARKVMKLISEVAIDNEVSESELTYFKKDLLRLKFKQLEIEYFEILESGGFDFINNYIEEVYPDGYFGN